MEDKEIDEEYEKWVEIPLSLFDRYQKSYPFGERNKRKEGKLAYFAGRKKGMEERNRLRQALEDIVDPIGEIKRLLEPGERINGPVAIQLSNDPSHLKKIAKDALEAKP